MFCTNCGEQIVDGARFCLACRHPVAPAPMNPADGPTAHQEPVATPAATDPIPVAAQTAVARVATSTSPTGPAPIAVTPAAFGGFWRRLVGAVIDGILFYLIYLVFAGLLIVAESEAMARMVFDPASNSVQVVVGLWSTAGMVLPWLLGWLYFAGLEASRQQATPGKRLLGLRVADLSGRRASIIRTTFRNALKPVSAAFLMIGFLMAGITARKQALHDMLSGCLILRR